MMTNIVLKKKNRNDYIRPFIKWAGGKSQIIEILENNLPYHIKENKKIDKYVEPFIGGGALLFYLKSKYTIKEAIISDINKELVICYKVVQRSPKELIEKLYDLEKIYLDKTEKQRKEFYYTIRESYNNLIRDFDYNNYNILWITKAAYILFLNKTCFNGLFRTNKFGMFNVPFGKYKNPKICNELNILQASQALKNTEILCGDFEEVLPFIAKGTLVYLDPPYLPISKTSNFTSYSENGFTIEDQKRLSVFYKKLDKIGAFAMLSNSDPKNYDPNNNFFEENYKGFNIIRIKAKRMINCDATKRKEINELIIKNY